MNFIRRNWVAVMLIFALGASYIVSRQETLGRERALKSALVTACRGSSERTALNAAGFNALAARVASRGNKGDKKSARLYSASAYGISDLIPPPGSALGKGIAEVTLVDLPGEPAKFVLTAKAAAMQEYGCKSLYGVR